MKKLTITVNLATDVDLDNVHVDLVRQVCMPSDCDGYSNVRFQRSMESDGYDIVGDRLETEMEATQRVNAKKKILAKKKQDKQDEIERLEKALAKLKAKR